MPIEALDLKAFYFLGSYALRIGLILVFLPLPGFRLLPATVRVLLSIALGIVVCGIWQSPARPTPASEDLLAINILADSLTAASIGLVAALVVESFTFAGQIIATHAGFSYATMIDPMSESDSGIFPSLTSLTANLLLFQSPLYAGLIRALADAVRRTPSRAHIEAPQTVQVLLGFSSHCLEIGVRLALPVIALLLLADLCIGLFARMQPQIQFLPISFSLKLLAAVAATAALVPAFQWQFERLATHSVQILHLLPR